MQLLIRGGMVVDPVAMTITTADVLIRDGLVAAVGQALRVDDPAATETYAAEGMYVCPGFIDMHVHLREPGREDKETIRTGTRAAAMGGFTTIASMPNTNPVADNQAVVEFVKARAASEGVVRVLPIGAITKGLQGQEMAEMGELVRSGVVGVSDDGKCVPTARLMRHVLQYAQMFGIPVMVHAEEPSLAEGDMNEGAVSTLLGLRGISNLAEEAIVARDLLLAEDTRGRLHICHVSTRRSVEMIRASKARGVRVTAEATPHHFSLTDEAVTTWNTSTKVSPPLRCEADRQAIIQGLADGTIDAIATDHAPHNREEKDVEYAVAANGLVGLETAVPLAITNLVRAGYLDIMAVVRKFTTGPAGALGIASPRLAPGAVADVTVVDSSMTSTVAPERFESKGRNTPFAGMLLAGWPVLTVFGGRVVMKDRVLRA